MSFGLIVQLIILAIMAFSAINYLLQRSSNKQSLNQVISSSEAIRQLTDDEYQLLTPYLNDKKLIGSYKHQTSLINFHVSVISGECTRHSFSTNGSESSYYFAIGNIEVFFPYGMEKYTIGNNIAEVVFTEQYAFVVNLNGYSLAEAKADRDREALLDEQWAAGSRGEFKTVTDQDLTLIQNNEQSELLVPLIEAASHLRCEIVEQREETPLETLRRSPSNSGFLSALCLTIASIIALCYIDNDIVLFILSSILLLAAIVFYFIKPKRQIQKVNRVKGTVADKVEGTRELIIGDSLTIIYPKYWQPLLPNKTATEVDIDVEVTKREMLRYGHTLSISREIEQYGPPRFWGRNCFLAIVGFILLALLYFIPDSIKSDMLYTYGQFTGDTQSFTINDDKALKNVAVEVGDWVNLDLQGASCEANSLYLCRRVFINNNTINLDGILDPSTEWITKLHKGELVKTVYDADVQLMETYNSLFNMFGDSYSSNKESFTKIVDFNELALITDQACDESGTVSQSQQCKQLKYIFKQLIVDDADEADSEDKYFEQWDDLVQFAKTHPQDGIVYSSTALEIKQLFMTISHLVKNKPTTKLKELLITHQLDKNSVIISNANSRFSVTFGNEQGRYDENNILYYYSLLQDGAGHIVTKGLVTDIVKNSDGTNREISLDIDYPYSPNNSRLSPIIITLTFALVVLFFISQLMIWIVKIVINKRRINKIISNYGNTLY